MRRTSSSPRNGTIAAAPQISGLILADSGGKEDAAAVQAIQAGLTSGANEHFTFGRYEKAIVHFHEVLSASLQGLPRD